MKSIIILTISDLRFEANLHRKAQSLRQAGYRVTLLATYHPDVDEKSWPGIELIRLRLIKNPTALKFAHFIVKTVFWLWQQRADLYISYDYLPLLPLRLKQIFHRITWLYDSVELLVGMNQLQGRPVRKRLWKVYERMAIHSAGAILTVCHSDACHLQKVYPGIPQPVMVRNIPIFQQGETDRSFLRKQFNIPDRYRIGIYQGAIFKGRGLRPLMRATAQISHLALVIMGEGPLLPELRVLASTLGLSDRVIFTGGLPFEQLSPYTAGADMGFTLISGKGLSYYHALPNKLFEYIQAEVPVIGSDYPEIKKVIEEDGIGYAVPPEDVQTIAGAIEEMLKEENYRRFKQKLQGIRDKYRWQEEKIIYLQTVAGLLGNS